MLHVGGRGVQLSMWACRSSAAGARAHARLSGPCVAGFTLHHARQHPTPAPFTRASMLDSTNLSRVGAGARVWPGKACRASWPAAAPLAVVRQQSGANAVHSATCTPRPCKTPPTTLLASPVSEQALAWLYQLLDGPVSGQRTAHAANRGIRRDVDRPCDPLTACQHWRGVYTVALCNGTID